MTKKAAQITKFPRDFWCDWNLWRVVATESRIEICSDISSCAKVCVCVCMCVWLIAVELFAQIDFNWNFHFYFRRYILYANSLNPDSFMSPLGALTLVDNQTSRQTGTFLLPHEMLEKTNMLHIFDCRICIRSTCVPQPNLYIGLSWIYVHIHFHWDSVTAVYLFTSWPHNSTNMLVYMSI